MSFHTFRYELDQARERRRVEDPDRVGTIWVTMGNGDYPGEIVVPIPGTDWYPVRLASGEIWPARDIAQRKWKDGQHVEAEWMGTGIGPEGLIIRETMPEPIAFFVDVRRPSPLPDEVYMITSPTLYENLGAADGTNLVRQLAAGSGVVVAHTSTASNPPYVRYFTRAGGWQTFAFPAANGVTFLFTWNGIAYAGRTGINATSRFVDFYRMDASGGTLEFSDDLLVNLNSVQRAVTFGDELILLGGFGGVVLIYNLVTHVVQTPITVPHYYQGDVTFEGEPSSTLQANIYHIQKVGQNYYAVSWNNETYDSSDIFSDPTLIDPARLYWWKTTSPTVEASWMLVGSLTGEVERNAFPNLGALFGPFGNVSFGLNTESGFYVEPDTEALWCSDCSSSGDDAPEWSTEAPIHLGLHLSETQTHEVNLPRLFRLPSSANGGGYEYKISATTTAFFPIQQQAFGRTFTEVDGVIVFPGLEPTFGSVPPFRPHSLGVFGYDRATGTVSRYGIPEVEFGDKGGAQLLVQGEAI